MCTVGSFTTSNRACSKDAKKGHMHFKYNHPKDIFSKSTFLLFNTVTIGVDRQIVVKSALLRTEKRKGPC